MTAAPANAGGKQGGRFRKGRSGNPAGKKPGTRHRATIAVETLFKNEAESIGRKVIELALDGDSTCLRLALERIAPVRRGRPVQFTLPRLDAAGDLPKALAAVLAAIAAGELTTDEGLALSQIIEHRRRSIETMELEGRVAVLEQREEKDK